MKIVIVGGGVAAFEAALSAGKAGVPCEITLISREKVNVFPVTDGTGHLLGIIELQKIRKVLFRQELFHSEDLCVHWRNPDRPS